jgi:CBS domain-containing protein
MATAGQFLKTKGHDVVSLPPTATALEAAQRMNEHRTGSVLVVEGDTMVGIFTERDVLRRVVAESRDPAATALSKVMTRKVAYAGPDTTLDEIRRVMRDSRIRHMPVLENNRVTGMISIGDLNKAENARHVETIKYLEQYMSVP